jgi:hexosaminidase
MVALTSCTTSGPALSPSDTFPPLSDATRPPDPAAAGAFRTLIPKPVSASYTGGSFRLAQDATIVVQPASPELLGLGRALAERLNRAPGYRIGLAPAGAALAPGSILLTVSDSAPALGDEGYELQIGGEGLRLSARRPAGVFYGIQTLRQLLPPALESQTPPDAPLTLPTGTIRDRPRFAWRGAMLDVSRHFFSVEEVKRLIDLIAAYKLNRLHLHLTDDQGWRLMINSWPRLATYGGSTAIGDGPGGYYTQADYAAIVAHAQSRYVMIVPEIDMPGHTNAALASYAELNCDGKAPPLYTGVQVGFSSLCIDSETTYAFIDDVVGELAALTPGPYIHIGGDETLTLQQADYVRFIERVQGIVEKHGKRVIGWEEIAQARLTPGAVVQHWHNDQALAAARQGAKVIMSPASRSYLDMKYDAGSPLGLDWAGYIEVRDSYTWEPVSQVPGLAERDVLGVEAPLWTETIVTRADLDAMVFPRMLSVAEIGWSPAPGRAWEEYRLRLAAHGPRLRALGVGFHPSAQVPWP